MFKEEIYIDLHGLTEDQAYGPILNALFEMENNSNISAIIFITGKGTGTLQRVLENTLEENGYNWIQNSNNQGQYKVYRNN